MKTAPKKVNPIKCEHCGRTLDPSKVVWLEMDVKTGAVYHQFPFDAGRSQGSFPFGRECARVVAVDTPSG